MSAPYFESEKSRVLPTGLDETLALLSSLTGGTADLNSVITDTGAVRCAVVSAEGMV